MLREPEDADRDRVLSWRNHPRVRERSFTSHRISPDEHARWWHAVAADPDRTLKIFEWNERPVGVVTYELERDGSARWGFYLDVDGLEERAELLGAWFAIFEEGIDHAFRDLEVQRLHGEVLTDNTAVLRLHERYGFDVSEPFKREVDGEEREAVHVELRAQDRRDGRRSRTRHD